MSSFERAENSFLDKPVRGRRPTKNSRIIEAVSKLTTLEYFSKMMDDETEKQLWYTFITGMAPKLDDFGKPILLDGKPVMEKIEPNPTSYRAFQRAVEYKRGQPVVTVKPEGDPKGKVIEIITIGATTEYFEKAAKERGFLVRS